MRIKWFSIVLLLALATACGTNEQYTAAPSRPEPSVLEQVAGVWRASQDGTMVSFVYAQSKFQMLVGDSVIPVTVGDVDQTNKTFNLNVVRADGKPAVWTVRQIWDTEGKSFSLGLTMHDGTQDHLSFVRRISTDDLNVFAAAQSKGGKDTIAAAIQGAIVSPTLTAQPSTLPPAAPPPEPRPTVSVRDVGQEVPERLIRPPVQTLPPATVQEYVHLMIRHAMQEGLVDAWANILEAKGRIEAFDLKNQVVQRQRKKAREANEQGLGYIRAWQFAEAVQAFRTAYAADPADVEVINNLGHAYVRQGNFPAAEQWLLRTLTMAPGRSSAWGDLGQAYASQGEIKKGVACFANAYRFARNHDASRRFFESLADDEHQYPTVREAARNVLQLRLVQAQSGAL
jgi:Tfp pilus assembly protein PilF